MSPMDWIRMPCRIHVCVAAEIKVWKELYCSLIFVLHNSDHHCHRDIIITCANVQFKPRGDECSREYSVPMEKNRQLFLSLKELMTPAGCWGTYRRIAFKLWITKSFQSFTSCWILCSELQSRRRGSCEKTSWANYLQERTAMIK